MQTLIDKAAVLIEALPYIQHFKGKKVVIKYGGSVIGEEAHCEAILRDVVFMRTVGMHPILVHGGGRLITERLKKIGTPSRFIHGLRYTDEATMKIVLEVLRESISKNIAKILKRLGAVPMLFSGIDHNMIQCRKKNKHRGEAIDLGWVGEIIKIRTDEIMEACEWGKVPVVAPIGTDAQGNHYNINADSMAGELASEIGAYKMVYLSDIPGILRDVNDSESLISSLKKSEVETLIEKKVISGGMIPKVESCLKSLEAGSRKTHIIDGRVPHSLLLEMFTDKGIGTEIIPD
jgi:acetylglutamate kinase